MAVFSRAEYDIHHDKGKKDFQDWERDRKCHTRGHCSLYAMLEAIPDIVLQQVRSSWLLLRVRAGGWLCTIGG